MGIPGRIGEYQPFAELNRGPVTIVYKAYQESLGRVVLVKVLRPAYAHVDDIVQQFETEARLLAQIQHPNVVTIYSCGREDDRSYFVAEFIEGTDLKELLAAAGNFPLELGTYVIAEVARGLEAAHQENILHRDIKPGNILIGWDGRIKLTDFGMASIIPDGEKESEIRGTPGYMAPEQLADDTASRATDMFALGVTLYELIGGRRAFFGDDIEESIDAVLNRDPLPALDMFRPLPEELKEILGHLLAKDPADRWDRAAPLIEALEEFRAQVGFSAGAAQLKEFIEDPAAYEPRTAASDIRVLDGSNPEAEESEELPSEHPTDARRSYSNRFSVTYRAAAAIVSLIFLAAAGYVISKQSAPAGTSPSTLQGRTVVLPDSVRIRDPMSNYVSGFLFPAGDRTEGRANDRSRSEYGPVDTPTDGRDGAEVDSAGVMPTGRLLVRTESEAVVYVAGDSIGQAPFEAPVELPAGRHQLVVRHVDFPVYRDSVTVRAERQTEVDVALVSLMGTLSVRVNPWAEVAIDGVVRDTIPYRKEPFLVSPGIHHITLKHPEYGVRDTLLLFSEGQDHSIEFRFQDIVKE